MGDNDTPRPLEELDARLRSARAADEGAGRRGPDGSRAKEGLGAVMRVGVELVAGLVVGGGIGWLLDRWLGTAPWLMVVFFLLGAAAGLLNVYRAVSGLGMQAGYRRDKQRLDR